jgi:exodeoxyribonuclease-3
LEDGRNCRHFEVSRCKAPDIGVAAGCQLERLALADHATHGNSGSTVKIISWNVNGLRAALRKNFIDYLIAESPDILCVQETKAREEDVPQAWPPGYKAYWNSAEKKGYSGTCIITRQQPIEVRSGIGVSKHDAEGRVLVAEFPQFQLVNVYTPNSQRELTRLPYRQEWDRDFLSFLRGIQATKPVIVCGDLNVAHTELDLTHPKANTRNHGFTNEERAGFDALLNAGFVDSFREFNKQGGHYTWWSPMNRARERNVGWRIDYFLISQVLKPNLVEAFIHKDIGGSDHCPVGVFLKTAE